MRRLWWLGLVVAAASLAGIAPASAATTAPDITCASGYFRITNHYADAQEGNTGGGITAEGQGNPVIYLGTAGSCFRVRNQFVDGHGNTSQQYQNEGGSCLQLVGSWMDVDPCGVQGTPSQTFFGFSFTRGIGWLMEYESPYGQSWDLEGGLCQNGELVGHDTHPSCWGWNFPS